MESHNEKDSLQEKTLAFLPFTLGGVARFGYAQKVFLSSVEVVVALFCTLCVLWFFCGAYFPVISSAVIALPEEPVKISGQQLIWDEPDGILAQSRKLSVVVNAYGEGREGRESDISLELAPRHINLHSCGYYIEIPYGDSDFSLNRKRAIPWWQAWKGPVIFWVGLITFCALIVIWQVLSLFYMFWVKLIAEITHRKAPWAGCYALSGAALMPGAILMGLAILGYGANFYGLETLPIALALHFIIGWVYLLICPFLLPKAPRDETAFDKKSTSSGPLLLGNSSRDNPFSAQKSPAKSSIFGGEKKNPFR